MKEEFKKSIEELIDKHLPVAFLNYEVLTQFKNIVFNQSEFGRKEILIFAYIIGATSEESNELLDMLNYPKLYVKKREDAIWKFVLDNHMDSAFVINNIFLQNVDEII